MLHVGSHNSVKVPYFHKYIRNYVKRPILFNDDVRDLVERISHNENTLMQLHTFLSGENLKISVEKSLISLIFCSKH